MRSELSEYMWKTRIVLIHLVSFLETYAQEVWEGNRMDSDMHGMLFEMKLLKATLLNMYIENVQSNIDGDDSAETS